jgi:hypothetical protein
MTLTISVGLLEVKALDVVLAALLARLLDLMLHLLLALLHLAKAGNGRALLAPLFQPLNPLVLALSHAHLPPLHRLGQLRHQLHDGRHRCVSRLAPHDFLLLASLLLFNLALRALLGLADHALQRLRDGATGAGRRNDLSLLAASRLPSPLGERDSQHQDQSEPQHLERKRVSERETQPYFFPLSVTAKTALIVKQQRSHLERAPPQVLQISTSRD